MHSPEASEQRHHAEVDEEETDAEVDDGVVDVDEALALQDEDYRCQQAALRHTVNKTARQWYIRAVHFVYEYVSDA